MEQSVKTILSTLMSFRTTSDNREANTQGLTYIETFLIQRGLQVKRVEYNGYESLIAGPTLNKKPIVLLNAHLDVVPCSEDMFTLKELDGKLYGRGTYDMKFAIAAYLQVVENLQYHIKDYDFGIMINTDEEVGGFNGVKKLVEEGYLPKVVIIPDGGENWAIETFAKGILNIAVTVNGRSAHGSRPWEGESALDKLYIIIDALKQLMPNQSPETSTLVVTKVQAGEAINQVPSIAKAQIDVRSASADEHETIKEAALTLAREFDAEVNFEIDDPPCVNDPDNPFIKQFMASIENVIGYPSSTTVSLGANDGRYFNAKGVPCIIVRPPGNGLHGPEEWITEEGLLQLCQILENYLQKVARAHNKKSSVKSAEPYKIT